MITTISLQTTIETLSCLPADAKSVHMLAIPHLCDQLNNKIQEIDYNKLIIDDINKINNLDDAFFYTASIKGLLRKTIYFSTDIFTIMSIIIKIHEFPKNFDAHNYGCSTFSCANKNNIPPDVKKFVKTMNDNFRNIYYECESLDIKVDMDRIDIIAEGIIPVILNGSSIISNCEFKDTKAYIITGDCK